MTDQLALEGPAPKKSSPIPAIGAIAVLCLLGLGGGWFVGKMLFVPAPPAAAAPAMRLQRKLQRRESMAKHQKQRLMASPPRMAMARP